MTGSQKASSPLSPQESAQLLKSLLHKEGNWIDWGQACQKLQKAGFGPQEIFEATGFQGSQQNLVIVAAQVYDSLKTVGLSEAVLSYFQGPKSDVLYEFRVLNQEQRAAAALLAQEKQLDVDGAHEVAKAYKEFSRLSQLPEGFIRAPGDAVAYQCWKRARQKKDLQERSRLIAQGLKFAQSPSAREAIEKLLSDFTVVPSRTAPLMPVYRLEVEEELPRIIPLAGSLPLKKIAFEQITALAVQEPFRAVQISGNVTVVPVPGWQVMLKAIDPIGIFCLSDRLPKSLGDKPEQVLVVVDRQVRDWDVNAYFLIEQEGQLELRWFEEPPELQLLGQVILILRPKKILDENNLIEPWQMDD